ncbi:E3 ubiquitin/ISG15 ligase TRIM25-like isoform X2 [Salarias fasciatus]|uniref:E3 ubiquitin/ISG15 ligase TRIM25-like n=2 Tax=Salarias fasciatus TaxID=181472 RepID=A0A672GAF6_SALFA|nr:E3 ubiquitin/ISG15 ligase TRIM25-like isoform X2 [Salarias fasciatus]
MATASAFLSEDQFLCSICLDVFTEPVSIPCGHNFCKACLSQHWEGKEQCQCPLCNEKFSKGLKLRVNTAFRDVVENFKRHRVTAESSFPGAPGQVLCDCCLGNKSRASKTCLACLASFCETHLEPHQRVSTLKRHKLTRPVQNLEDKICKEHSRILEFFCLNDQTRVCALCTEHSTHDTVPLDEEYVDKQAQMRQKIKQKGGREMRAGAQSKRKGKFNARANRMVSHQMSEPINSRFPTEGLHCWSDYSYIPGNRGFSGGRFYFEVQTKGKRAWDLGVVSESVRGKRSPNCANGKWMVSFRDCNCRTPHHLPGVQRRPAKVVVFVDYENGVVLFYDAGNASMIHIFTGCNFEGRLFLFFSFSHSDDDHCVGRLQKRIESGVQQMWQQSNPCCVILLSLLFLTVLYIILQQ